MIYYSIFIQERTWSPNRIKSWWKMISWKNWEKIIYCYIYLDDLEERILIRLKGLDSWLLFNNYGRSLIFLDDLLWIWIWIVLGLEYNILFTWRFRGNKKKKFALALVSKTWKMRKLTLGCFEKDDACDSSRAWLWMFLHWMYASKRKFLKFGYF